MLQVLRDFAKVFTWEEPEMVDWIKLKLGPQWGEGNEDLFIRISKIVAVTGAPGYKGHSIIHLDDDDFNVVGTPEEIMEMINART